MSNPGMHIFTTTDGTTFNQTYFSAGGGAMMPRMLSETEVWVAATEKGAIEVRGARCETCNTQLDETKQNSLRMQH